MSKAAAFHGIEGCKYFGKTEDGYSATSIPVDFAMSLNLTTLLESVERYADNRLLFRIPKDDGFEGEFGSTGQDVAFEKSLGYVVDGTNGVIKTDLISYARGAFYYEFSERDESGNPSKVKAIIYNVEIGKPGESLQTDTNSAEFGDYVYPIRVFGDELLDSTSEKPYVDENGFGRNAFIAVCRPSDTGYSTFGDTVPKPQLKTAG